MNKVPEFLIKPNKHGKLRKQNPIVALVTLILRTFQR